VVLVVDEINEYGAWNIGGIIWTGKKLKYSEGSGGAQLAVSVPLF
jgi:hypothetical protein